ncbi:MAG: alpha-galactosidase [Proteobacteria bacterium]|nr:alpha-galactosidase [Pseudomonadota bacterium]
MESPEIYVAHSDQGFNGISRKFHSYVRNRIVKFPEPQKARPVTINTWEAVYFNHNNKGLKKLVDISAAVGCERFVLDDGWFHNRNDDTSSLGDWVPDLRKFPQGLNPLADYVVSKGMEFGLWVEPEMVNQDSDLYRKHPEWALSLEVYPEVEGRNQLVLDLTNPDVEEYIFECLETLLSKTSIQYLKWDMNRALVMPGNKEEKAVAYRYVKVLYSLIDRIREKFPQVEIESCASGGGRIDFEILKRTHRFWPSDSNDAIERIKIQMGMSYFFPPEVMGTHIGPESCHTSGRRFHRIFQNLVASYGHFGMEADLSKLSHNELQELKDLVVSYKSDRKLWHTGNFSRVRTIDPSLLGVSVVSEDQKTARLTMYQIDRPRDIIPPLVKIPGLEQNQTYRVRLHSNLENALKNSRSFENPLLKNGVELPGMILTQVGVQLPVLSAQTGLSIICEAV